jgi:hypothetical protein
MAIFMGVDFFEQKVTKETKGLSRWASAKISIFLCFGFEKDLLEHPSFSSFPSVKLFFELLDRKITEG